MKYKLEWTLGKFESSDWNLIQSHPEFSNGTAFEMTPIGWCAT